jgi:hypothetical protein
VSDRLTEDPLTMIRRHVLEAEGHVARQRAFVAKLVRSGNAVVAADARVVLATLEKSLELAREHLSTEIEKRSHKPGRSN